MSGRNATVKPTIVHEGSRFAEYRNRVFEYYQEKKFSDALITAQEASKRFPEFDPKTSFWIACLQSRLCNYPEAIRTLQAATSRGVWWRDETFRDSDLDPIRGRPEFETIREDCRRLQRQSSKIAEPELLVRTPSNFSDSQDWTALMVLHQRYGERPEISAEPWDGVTREGVVLASPWSSQVYAPDGRCWDDVELAQQDVIWAYSELSRRTRIGSNGLVLGGFSQGAALSVYCTLKRLVPSRGFVAVASSDWVQPEAKQATDRAEISKPFADSVKASDCRGLKGVVMIGDKDPFFSKVEKLYGIMVERGLDGKLIVEPGLGHEYPKEFDTKLSSAVNFVLG